MTVYQGSNNIGDECLQPKKINTAVVISKEKAQRI